MAAMGVVPWTMLGAGLFSAVPAQDLDKFFSASLRALFPGITIGPGTINRFP
jgi:hypothetical protein